VASLDTAEIQLAPRLDTLASSLEASATRSGESLLVAAAALDAASREIASILSRVKAKETGLSSILIRCQGLAEVESELLQRDDITGNRGDTSHPWIELLRVLISWPLVGLVALAALAFSPNVRFALWRLTRLFRRVKVIGAEFVFDEQASKEAEEAFDLYGQQAQRELDKRVDVYGVRKKLEAVFEEMIHPALAGQPGGEPGDIRCTVYMPDVVFTEATYQLLDYYPRGSGRGRRFSTGFGIVGRVFRSGQSESQGDVPTSVQELVRQWGMTTEQASAQRHGWDRQSFLCVVLKDDKKSMVGLLYCDTKKVNAWGSPAEAYKLIEDVGLACKEHGLTDVLSKIFAEVQVRGPRIAIFSR
jgi:hypothetical protein